MKMIQAIRDYFRLGVIIGALPNNITNGQPLDAVPVMADFNWIVSQVNANVPALIPQFTAVAPFTPRLAFGGSSAGITYSLQTGFFASIGSLYFITIQMALTSKGAAAGIATIEALPAVIAAAIGGNNPIGYANMQNVTFAGNYVLLTGTGGSTSMTFARTTSAGVLNFITDAGFANNSLVFASVLYSA